MTRVYQYPKCSTCRNALKWLASRGVEVTSIDIVETPPPLKELKSAYKQSGLPLAKFFNTSGVSYREGGFKQKLKTLSETEALKALAADGKLIKRPLLISDGFVLVGFKDAEYAAQFGVRGVESL